MKYAICCHAVYVSLHCCGTYVVIFWNDLKKKNLQAVKSFQRYGVMCVILMFFPWISTVDINSHTSPVGLSICSVYCHWHRECSMDLSESKAMTTPGEFGTNCALYRSTGITSLLCQNVKTFLFHLLYRLFI